MAPNLQALISSTTNPNLSGLTNEDAVAVLKGRATVLNVGTLDPKWQKLISTIQPGIVPGLIVQGKFDAEPVIVCQSTWTSKTPNRDAFTWSEYEWLMVEVNTLWRRAKAEVIGSGIRKKIPFVCRHCNQDMVDKSYLGWHRQTDQCNGYDMAKQGMLKIFPSMGQDGNKAARAVFTKYGMNIPTQMFHVSSKKSLSPKHGKKFTRQSTKGAKNAKGAKGTRVECDDYHITNATDFSSDDDLPLAFLTSKTKNQNVHMKSSIADKLKKRPATHAGIGEQGGKKTWQGQNKMQDKGTSKPGHSSHTTRAGQETQTSGVSAPLKAPGRPWTRSTQTKEMSPSITPSMDTTTIGLRPTSFGLKEYTVEARKEVEVTALEQSLERIPNVDPTLRPTKLGTSPGLYTLVEQSGHIISLNLMTDLVAPVMEIKMLYEAGRLARKVFEAWGIFQWRHEATEEFNACVIKAVDKCTDAFKQKSTALMDAEIEAFVQHHNDVHSYSKRLEEFSNAVKDTERKRAEYVEEQMGKFDRGVQMVLEEMLVAAQKQVQSGKRKVVENAVAPIGKKHAGPKYDLDPDMLECPLCLETFSPPVYQCENGHTACSGCCQMITKGCPSCSKPIGRIRNIAIEKVIESLQVECKHACHGCNTMLKYTERAKHEEKLCEYRPTPCPVTRYPRHCAYAGPKASIPAHLKDEHKMRIVESSGSMMSASFKRNSSHGGVLFKAKEIWLMVCWLEHFQGDAFRCDPVGASQGVGYKLTVKPVNESSRVYSMENVAHDKTGEASCSDTNLVLVPGGFEEHEITVSLIR
ncbi:hypothetical protein M758_3G134000 [Ceratodon purpureus]|nr:hypothetical protein M758_3G134000 [Ceratodon purpureus]